MSDLWRHGGRSAGLIAGPACWAASTQAAYSVAAQHCAAQRAILELLMAALMAAAVLGALVSLFFARPLSGERFTPQGGTPGRWLGLVGFGSGLLFAGVIASQFAALLVIERCLR